MAAVELREGFTNSRARLQYVEAGPREGEPLVLLPGWPQTAYAWRRVQPKLAEAGYRTLAFHLPSQGESAFMSEDVGYSADAVAEVVHEAMASLGVGRADVVSHDVGGWIAFSLAVSFPQSLRHLVLIETQLLGISPSPQVSNAPRAFQYFFNYVPGLGEMLTKGREREFLAFLFQHKALKPEAIGEDDLDKYIETYADPERMRSGFNYYRAVPQNMKAHAEAAQLPMPVLALGGEGGVGMSLHDSLKTRCLDLQGGQLDGVGHYLPEEAPEELSRRILAFLQSRAGDLPHT